MDAHGVSLACIALWRSVQTGRSASGNVLHDESVQTVIRDVVPNRVANTDRLSGFSQSDGRDVHVSGDNRKMSGNDIWGYIAAPPVRGRHYTGMHGSPTEHRHSFPPCRGSRDMKRRASRARNRNRMLASRNERETGTRHGDNYQSTDCLA